LTLGGAQQSLLLLFPYTVKCQHICLSQFILDFAIGLLASLLYTQIWLCQNISPHVGCCLATTLIQNENPMKVVLWDHACFGNDAPPEKLMKVAHLTHYGLATACTHAVVTYDRGHKTVISCPLEMIRF